MTFNLELFPPTEKQLVVHCKRLPYDVYIGRPGPWGNKYEIGRDGDRDAVIQLHEQWLYTQPALINALDNLAGCTLGCWCSPHACHGHTLAALAAVVRRAKETYPVKRPQFWENEALRRQAWQYRPRSKSGHDKHHESAAWYFCPYYPLSAFFSVFQYGTEGWKAWFAAEMLAHRPQGKIALSDSYHHLLDLAEHDPVILYGYKSQVTIWHGHHRIGASITANRQTIPAIIGAHNDIA